LVRLIAILDVETSLGFEIEKEEFPAKSPAGETVTTALVDPGCIAAGTIISTVVDFPGGILWIETPGHTSKVIWLFCTVPFSPSLYCPFTSSFADIFGAPVPIPTFTSLFPSTMVLACEVVAPYPIAVEYCPEALAPEPIAVEF